MTISAATGQVVALGAAASWMENPLQKGSVFEAGRNKIAWVTLLKFGKNWTDASESWNVDEKFFMSDLAVNSPHRRSPVKAMQHAV